MLNYFGPSPGRAGQGAAISWVPFQYISTTIGGGLAGLCSEVVTHRWKDVTVTCPVCEMILTDTNMISLEQYCSVIRQEEECEGGTGLCLEGGG